MGNVHEGNADFLVDVFQHLLHMMAQLQVQRTQRLIQKQRARLKHQGTRQSNALLHAAGKLARLVVFMAAQLHQVNHARHALRNVVFGNAAAFQTVSDVFLDAHMGKQRIILEHGMHIALVGGHVGDNLSIKPDNARCGKFQTREHLEHGCFA